MPVLKVYDGTQWVEVPIGASDHGDLTGLSDDDHTQYALLAGRAGGQTLTGGTNGTNDLTLVSTSAGSKGQIFLGAATVHRGNFDESSGALNLGGTAAGVERMEVNGAIALKEVTGIESSPSGTSGYGKLFCRSSDNDLVYVKEDSTEINLLEHGEMDGLTTADDHTQYALLAGRGTGSGQTLNGGLVNGTLTLTSTLAGTPGGIYFGAPGSPDIQSVFSDINGWWGIGTTNPQDRLTIDGATAILSSSAPTDPSAGHVKLYAPTSDDTVNLVIPSSPVQDIDLRNHGTLKNLTSADDHTQYVHNTNARTITAQHTFNAAGSPAPIAPFAIGANSTDALVSGLNADQVDGLDAIQFALANGTRPSWAQSATAPLSPSNGDAWYRTTGKRKLFIYNGSVSPGRWEAQESIMINGSRLDNPASNGDWIGFHRINALSANGRGWILPFDALIFSMGIASNASPNLGTHSVDLRVDSADVHTVSWPNDGSDNYAEETTDLVIGAEAPFRCQINVGTGTAPSLVRVFLMCREVVTV